ncbi:hypothetical protein L6258_01275 [Candidatus Parcubacteria bacterium]|nr:hypothetical protein [Candidatus Parcubacteria bacterium]
MKPRTNRGEKAFARIVRLVSKIIGEPVHFYQNEKARTAHWRVPYSGFNLTLLLEEQPDSSINLFFVPDGSSRNLASYQPLIERFVGIFRSRTHWIRSRLKVGETKRIWHWWTPNAHIAEIIAQQLVAND